jgi:hypothetical protein
VKRGLAALVVFTAIGIALLWPALAGGQVLSAAHGWADSGPFPASLRLRVPIEGRLQADEGLQFAPWLHYAATAWARDGEFPLWKATANCGAPLLGNGQSALLFPPNLLAILLGAPAWISAVVALMKIVGGMFGAWLLGRHLGLSWQASVLCGVVFGLGGFEGVWILHALTNPAMLFPWLILMTDRVAQHGRRSDIAGLALVAGLQHLGGHPETAFHCHVAACAVGAARLLSQRATLGTAASWRRAGALAFGLALGALLGAVQTLPVGEYILNSDALAQRSAHSVSTVADYPWQTLTFVAAVVVAVLAARRVAYSGNPWPWALLLCIAVSAGVMAHMQITWDTGYLLPFASDWYGSVVAYLGPPNYVERNGAYAGAALALAAVGWIHGRPRGVARVAAVMAALGLLVGYNSPLLDHLLSVLPVFKVAANLRLQLWSLLGLAVLAGLGLDALGQVPRGRLVRARAPLLLCALALGAWLGNGLGIQLEYTTLRINPTTAEGDVSIKATLGPRGDMAAMAPDVFQRFEERGIASRETSPQGVIGWAWLPASPDWIWLEYAPEGSGTALSVSHESAAEARGEPDGGDGDAGYRRYSFVAVIPPTALASGHVRARVCAVLGDGRRAVSDVLTPSNDTGDERFPMPWRPAPGTGGRQALLLGVAVLLAAVAIHARGALLASLRLLLFVPVLGTLMPFIEAMLPMLPPDLHYPDTAKLMSIAKLAPDGRVFALEPWRLPREVATWYGIRDASGYDALAPARVASLLRAAADRPGGHATVEELPTRRDVDRGLLGLAAVEVFVGVPGVQSMMSDVLNDGFLPRARLVTGAELEHDDERALQRLASPDFPRETSVVLAAGPPRNAAPSQAPPPRITVDRPDRVVVEIEPDVPCLLTLADTDFPGWLAFVDGSARPILRANVAFRAVEVWPGERAVEFRYEPISVRAGLLLSAIAAGVCLALVLRDRPLGLRAASPSPFSRGP